MKRVYKLICSVETLEMAFPKMPVFAKVVADVGNSSPLLDLTLSLT